MTKVALYSLLKFGSEQHISDLYRNGTVYFNPIEKFRTDEDGNLRGDIYEGNTWVSNQFNCDVCLLQDGKEIPLGNAANIHMRGFKEQLKGNVFCMYAIHTGTLKDGALSFDKRAEELGTHFLAVDSGNIQVFLERIWVQLELAGINIYGADLVKYYDAESGTFLQTDLFMKRIEYSFQNEFRIFAHSDLTVPFTIKIGSLEDIATVCESSSIFK